MVSVTKDSRHQKSTNPTLLHEALKDELVRLWIVNTPHTVSTIVDNINLLIRKFDKKSSKRIAYTHVYPILCNCFKQGIDETTKDLEECNDITFENVLTVMKRFECKIDLLSNTLKSLKNAQDNSFTKLPSSFFSKGQIITHFISSNFYSKIPLEEAIKKNLIENIGGDEKSIYQLVEFAKFLCEYDRCESPQTSVMEQMIKIMIESFRSYISDISSDGKFDIVIKIWSNFIKFGTFLGPNIKNQFRMMGFEEIFADSELLLTLLKNGQKRWINFAMYHSLWEDAYKLKHNKSPNRSHWVKSNIPHVQLRQIDDDFGLNFLTINRIIFNHYNFENTFQQVKSLDPGPRLQGGKYYSLLLEELCTCFLNTIEGSPNQYYCSLAKFLNQKYYHFKEDYKNKSMDTDLRNDYSYLSYFIERYCPKYEMFLKRYWLPRFIKIIAKPPADDPLGHIIKDFNSHIYSNLKKECIDDKNKLLKFIEEAIENEEDLENGSTFTCMLIPQYHVNIDVPPSETFWATNYFKKRWQAVITELSSTSKKIENNTAIHYVLIETPIKLSDKSYLLVQTDMSIAAILYCFNTNDIMTIESLINTIKITKSQSKQFFSSLNKLIRSKLLIKDKNRIKFNYAYDCSGLDSNILRL